MAPTVTLDLHYKVKGHAGSMLIGQLADVAGLATQTIRFYERSGLLPSPLREANGYRVYDDTALNRLNFIRAAQAAGLTLGEIRGIVDLRDDGDVPCAHVTTLLFAKLDDVRARRRELDEAVAFIADLRAVPHPALVGLANLPLIPERDYDGALHSRLTEVEARIASVRDAERSQAPLPRPAREVFSYSLSLLEAERSWLAERVQVSDE